MLAYESRSVFTHCIIKFSRYSLIWAWKGNSSARKDLQHNGNLRYWALMISSVSSGHCCYAQSYYKYSDTFRPGMSSLMLVMGIWLLIVRMNEYVFLSVYVDFWTICSGQRIRSGPRYSLPHRNGKKLTG